MFLEQFGNVTVGIFQITKDTSTSGTGFYTGGKEAFCGALNAEITLVYSACFTVSETHTIIRTGVNAKITIDTASGIDHHNSVFFTFKRSSSRTYFGTYWVVALIAK
ncbi:hypothetical protein PBPRB1371 [Photobacterium profundum SS9]|uniref:Uncharacterized protein n=1 Tax=Photobacterium profundum (strain SS9) TaxID=298386 RepID=Q6LHJ2_PHOPR|nr:hypothetical protein PBPRB1371 [Photobacterium profundum SS9]